MIKKIIKASRPPTLVVTFISTTLGMVIAYRVGYLFHNLQWDIFRIFLITFAGLLLQSGVNLINNYFEEEVDEEIKKRRTLTFLGFRRSGDEILVFKAGLIFFLIVALIGIYLSYYSGIELFIIEIIGIFSAYAYSGKPFNYKQYGLGALMSFIMMGPLMIYSSYFVFSTSFSIIPIVYSLTLGLFIPAILLGNEIRDYEEDKKSGVGTLTVRLGYKRGVSLYYWLIIFAYFNTFILVLLKMLPLGTLVILSTLPLIKKIQVAIQENKRLIIPLTARLYFIFGIEFLIVLLL